MVSDPPPAAPTSASSTRESSPPLATSRSGAAGRPGVGLEHELDRVGPVRAGLASPTSIRNSAASIASRRSRSRTPLASCWPRRGAPSSAGPPLVAVLRARSRRRRRAAPCALDVAELVEHRRHRSACARTSSVEPRTCAARARVRRVRSSTARGCPARRRVGQVAAQVAREVGELDGGRPVTLDQRIEPLVDALGPTPSSCNPSAASALMPRASDSSRSIASARLRQHAAGGPGAAGGRAAAPAPRPHRGCGAIRSISRALEPRDIELRSRSAARSSSSRRRRSASRKPSCACASPGGRST